MFDTSTPLPNLEPLRTKCNRSGRPILPVGNVRLRTIAAPTVSFVVSAKSSAPYVLSSITRKLRETYANTDAQVAPRDTLTFLSPVGSKCAATKTFSPLPDGTVSVQSWTGGSKFEWVSVPVRSIYDVVDALETMRDSGRQYFLVGGTVADKTSDVIGKKATDLAKTAHCVLHLDVDGIEIPGAAAVAHDGAALARLVMSYLPPAVSSSTTVWRMSASAGLRVAGKTFSADAVRMHLSLMLDASLLPDAAAALVGGLSAYAAQKLSTDAVVFDPSVCAPTQAVFVHPPVLTGGLADPFPGSARLGVLDGVRDGVSVTDLRQQLQDAGITCPAQRTRRGGSKIRSSAVADCRPDTGDFAAETAHRALLLATPRVMSKAKRDFTTWATTLPYEIGTLLRTVIERGGSIEGFRDAAMVTSVATCLKATDITGLTPESITALTRQIAAIVLPAEHMPWFEKEWLAEDKGAALVDRALIAASGERTEWLGDVSEDVRYGYSRDRIHRMLVVPMGCQHLVLELGLRTLMSDVQVESLRRRRRGNRPLSEYRGALPSVRCSDTVRRLRREGRTYTEIATTAECSLATVRRILKPTAQPCQATGIHTVRYPIEEGAQADNPSTPNSLPVAVDECTSEIPHETAEPTADMSAVILPHPVARPFLATMRQRLRPRQPASARPVISSEVPCRPVATRPQVSRPAAWSRPGACIPDRRVSNTTTAANQHQAALSLSAANADMPPSPTQAATPIPTTTPSRTPFRMPGTRPLSAFQSSVVSPRGYEDGDGSPAVDDTWNVPEAPETPRRGPENPYLYYSRNPVTGAPMLVGPEDLVPPDGDEVPHGVVYGLGSRRPAVTASEHEAERSQLQRAHIVRAVIPDVELKPVSTAHLANEQRKAQNRHKSRQRAAEREQRRIAAGEPPKPMGTWQYLNQFGAQQPKRGKRR